MLRYTHDTNHNDHASHTKHLRSRSRTCLFLCLLCCIAPLLLSFDFPASAEVRNYVYRKILRGEKFTRERVFTQQDGSRFQINMRDNNINIIPEFYDNFEPNHRGSWDIGFASSGEIEYCKIFLQSEEGSYVYFQPNGYTSLVTVMIRNWTVLKDVQIPVPIKSVLTQSFEDVKRNVRSIIPWEWLLPNSDHFENYAGKQNFAGYAQQNFIIKSLDEQEQYALSHPVLQWYAFTLVDFANELLDFSEESLVSFFQFLPLNENRQRLPLSHPDFLFLFAKNLQDFLNQTPQLTASFDTVLPPHISLTGSLGALYSQMYMWSVRYPSYFYIVVIDELLSNDTDVEKRSAALRIYIPYFTPNGDFEYFLADFSKIESQHLNYENPNIQYSYRVLPLRVPFSFDVQYD